MTTTQRVSALLAIAALVGGAMALVTAEGQTSATPVAAPGLAKATFAGGCFWCMEPPFDELDGVISTTSGYTGGERQHPTYGEVSSGRTAHAEAVEVVYDPAKITYAQLLDVFWRNIDPLTRNRQFCDHGAQYRTAIFFHDAEQERLARKTKRQLEESGRFADPIVTQIAEAHQFWAAEDYHQDYYLKNPIRYKFYRFGCGRDRRLKELWGDDN
ncbi:MAG: peptide-methionine (S)-S-oxide reductase MsrA [Acidobacteria bacterium]|nr:peptide-methionine (S)-S-oxide reductase MsrA [Acidobacteriota bacterium]